MAIFQKPYSNVSQTIQEDTGVKWPNERHVACVLLLDTSSSMADNDGIGKLNEGLRVFKSQTVNDTKFDEHTKACIDIAIISFGPDVFVHQDFIPISNMNPPHLTANGATPMGGALNKAFDMIAHQKSRYNDLGTPYYRPWIFCITDGEPNDDYNAAAQKLKKMEYNKSVLGYCVGVENFNKNIMADIFNHDRIYELDNLDFPGLFEFVSNSLAVVRNSDPNSGRSAEVDAPGTLHKLTVEY